MSDFKLPDLGEGVHEGQIVRLMVREGDSIAEDAPLIEVETDKAAVEIPSPFGGVVEKWYVEEGQLVHVGDVMVTISDSPSLEGGGKGVGEARAREDAAQTSGVETHPPAPPLGGRGSAAAAAPPRGHDARNHGTAGNGRHRKPASPAVRRMAREMGLDLQTIDGSGPGGRITRADVQNAANKVGAPDSSPSLAGGGRGVGEVRVRDGGQSTSRRGTHPLTPSLEGRGKAGELARIAPVAPLPSPVARDLEGTSDKDAYGPIVRQSITQARGTIARTMSHSWATIPHVTDSDDADVTELDKFRRGYADPTDPSRKITMLAFVVRAAVKALQLHPIFNASFDEESGEILYKRYYHIAIGVQTERGLIAPVIRDADRMNIGQLSDAIMTIAENARSATFAVNDLRGGTFTVSNAGAMGGSRYSTPIITPPQVAVLAIGKTRMMPWVVRDDSSAGGTPAPTIQPRLIMPLSCSFDHRIIDGAQEIAFARQIIEDLENPARLLLSTG